MDTIRFIQDFGGLVVATVLLFAAASVLPKNIKKYVLVAGLAVIGFEAWMRFRNKKLLAEADAEREELRGRAVVLNERSDALQKKVAELNLQLEAMREQKQNLDEKKSFLDEKGMDLSNEKKQLDEESEALMQKNDDLLQEIDGSESLLDILEEARNSVEQLDREHGQDNPVVVGS